MNESQISVGSGAQYFDINAPENNFKLAIRYRGTSFNETQMRQNALGIAGQFLCFVEHKEQDTEFLTRVLTQKELQAPLAYRENDMSWSGYKNNRDNFIHTMSQLTLEKATLRDIELAKNLILLGTELGLHPLEKSFRFGATAFALALNNSSFDLEFLKFFASLHPNSFTDLNEEKETVIKIVLRANRKSEIVDWIAQNIPHEDIERNIQSVAKKAKSSKRAAVAIDLLQARLDKELIESALPTKANEVSKKQNKL